MLKPIIWIFLLLSIMFAAVHYFAIIGSLYWYVWWSDIFMHSWGGILIALGVHSLCSLSIIKIKPSTPVVILILFIATISWELFEFYFGLFDPTTYLTDTPQDILLAFTGGLLTHFFLRDYTIS